MPAPSGAKQRESRRKRRHPSPHLYAGRCAANRRGHRPARRGGALRDRMAQCAPFARPVDALFCPYPPPAQRGRMGPGHRGVDAGRSARRFRPRMAQHLRGPLPGVRGAPPRRALSGRADERRAPPPFAPRARGGHRHRLRQHLHHRHAPSGRPRAARLSARMPAPHAPFARPGRRRPPGRRVSARCGAFARKRRRSHLLQRDGHVHRRAGNLAHGPVRRAHLLPPLTAKSAGKKRLRPVLRPQVERRGLCASVPSAVSQAGHAPGGAFGAAVGVVLGVLARVHAQRHAARQAGGLSGNDARPRAGGVRRMRPAPDRRLPGRALCHGKSGGRPLFPLPQRGQRRQRLSQPRHRRQHGRYQPVAGRRGACRHRVLAPAGLPGDAL